MSGMFKSAPTVAIPAAPAVTPPPTMPDPFSPATLEAQRKASMAANSAGRSATVMTTRAPGSGGAAAPSAFTSLPYSAPTLSGS